MSQDFRFLDAAATRCSRDCTRDPTIDGVSGRDARPRGGVRREQRGSELYQRRRLHLSRAGSPSWRSRGCFRSLRRLRRVLRSRQESTGRVDDGHIDRAPVGPALPAVMPRQVDGLRSSWFAVFNKEFIKIVTFDADAGNHPGGVHHRSPRAAASRRRRPSPQPRLSGLARVWLHHVRVRSHDRAAFERARPSRSRRVAPFANFEQTLKAANAPYGASSSSRSASGRATTVQTCLGCRKRSQTVIGARHSGPRLAVVADR